MSSSSGLPNRKSLWNQSSLSRIILLGDLPVVCEQPISRLTASLPWFCACSSHSEVCSWKFKFEPCQNISLYNQTLSTMASFLFFKLPILIPKISHTFIILGFKVPALIKCNKIYYINWTKSTKASEIMYSVLGLAEYKLVSIHWINFRQLNYNDYLCLSFETDILHLWLFSQKVSSVVMFRSTTCSCSWLFIGYTFCTLTDIFMVVYTTKLYAQFFQDFLNSK